MNKIRTLSLNLGFCNSCFVFGQIIDLNWNWNWTIRIFLENPKLLTKLFNTVNSFPEYWFYHFWIQQKWTSQHENWRCRKTIFKKIKTLNCSYQFIKTIFHLCNHPLVSSPIHLVTPFFWKWNQSNYLHCNLDYFGNLLKPNYVSSLPTFRDMTTTS